MWIVVVKYKSNIKGRLFDSVIDVITYNESEFHLKTGNYIKDSNMIMMGNLAQYKLRYLEGMLKTPLKYSGDTDIGFPDRTVQFFNYGLVVLPS